MKHLLFSILALFSVVSMSFASTSLGPQPKNKTLPKVFVLGQFESSYDDLVLAYDQSLLTACNCTMKSAFGKWLGMLHELELYSQKQDVDIRGVKVWLHVFWNADGSIDHIAYHLRPNSKVIDDAVMSDLLVGFSKQYIFPLTAEAGYAHYSTGSFPVFGEVAED